jgi:hypothetical protein
MHVGVTAEAVGFRIGKNKGRMTLFAIDLDMLSLQRKFCGIVIESVNLPVKLPSFRTMAYLAAYFKIHPMGLILYPASQEQDQERNG